MVFVVVDVVDVHNISRPFWSVARCFFMCHKIIQSSRAGAGDGLGRRGGEGRERERVADGTWRRGEGRGRGEKEREEGRVSC